MNLLRRLLTTPLVALVLATLALPAAHAVTIDWVTVGNAGNGGDTTGFGGVSYQYRIMQYEWTNSQYVEFLNAIDPDGSNPNAVYNAAMGSDARGGVSLNSGASAGSKYSATINMGSKPVNFVSWFDAARVSNWLHNGAQAYGSTDATASAPQNTGAYTVGTGTSGTPPSKNVAADYWVPTEDEWYKAAYYTGTGTTYRTYGNGFDAAPTPVTASSVGDGSAGGTGNFANMNFSADWNGQNGNVTTIGMNGGTSFYGLYDASGNVYEWNDLDETGSFRGIRGGGYGDNAFNVSSANRSPFDPSLESVGIGFRIVPEPSTYAMALAGLACGGFSMWRRRKRA